jgi:hypothetical protein
VDSFAILVRTSEAKCPNVAHLQCSSVRIPTKDRTKCVTPKKIIRRFIIVDMNQTIIRSNNIGVLLKKFVKLPCSSVSFKQ